MTKEQKLLQKHKAEFEEAYSHSLDEQTGQLYNRFVTFISEAQIPLYHVLVVLDVLKAGVTEQIRKQQGLV